MTTTDETTTGTPAETMRRAAADMRNFASDEPWIAATADLLDEVADDRHASLPAWVEAAALKVARAYLGETAATTTSGPPEWNRFDATGIVTGREYGPDPAGHEDCTVNPCAYCATE